MGAEVSSTMRVFPRGVLALDLKFLCPSCNTKLAIDARWEGTAVTCPTCRNTAQVPRWSHRAAPVVRLSVDEVHFLSEPQHGAAEPAAT
jgi:transcription elongation factor Elf1